MAVNRFTVDVVTPEPMSRREYQRRAKELSDWMQAVGTADVAEKNANGAFAHGHTHVSNTDVACVTCTALSMDERN